MATQITLVLDGSEVGQILDCLSLRAEVWERTGEYLRGEKPANTFIVEECSNAEEAEEMEGCYRSIIMNIKTQRSAQNG